MKNKVLYFLFICLLAFAKISFAQERITYFDSLIQAQYDGTLIVTEKITVYHEGKNIRRGIYRDLPTRNGEKYELMEVLRNGNYEPNFVEERYGYYRINTGNDSYLHHPGVSEFTLKYKVWNLPKSYEGYDEIYWNVTGDEWAFPIEKVTAKLELPNEASIIQQASYIGKRGSKIPATYLGNAEYYTGYLNPGEQLTIAVGFTPNIIQISNVASNNQNTFKALLVAYCVYLFFLIYIWHKKGRDPSRKAIMPQYEPPKELTAAQAACLYDKGVKKNILAISFIQMISSGFLKLTTLKDKCLCFTVKSYLLERTTKEPENFEEEDVHWKDWLLTGNRDIALEKTGKRFKKRTEIRMKPYYTTNSLWVIIPTVLMYYLLEIYYHLFLELNTLDSIVALLFLPVLLSVLVCRICRDLLLQFVQALVICICIFWFGYSCYLDGSLVDLNVVAFLLLVCMTASIFSFLLYQPSPEGQRLTEYLEGLHMFLKATKRPSYKDIVKEQSLDEACMEKLFPYAMALGLEQEWETKFKKLFGPETYHTFIKSHPYTSHVFSQSFSSCMSKSSGGSSGGGGAGGGGGGGGGGGR